MDLRAPVGAHRFLAEMEPHHLDLLAGCASIKQFEGGEMIFRAGQPANGFYLIENGAVAIEGSVFEHGTITTDTLAAGEPLGWSWMFPPMSGTSAHGPPSQRPFFSSMPSVFINIATKISPLVINCFGE